MQISNELEVSLFLILVVASSDSSLISISVLQFESREILGEPKRFALFRIDSGQYAMVRRLSTGTRQTVEEHQGHPIELRRMPPDRGTSRHR